MMNTIQVTMKGKKKEEDLINTYKFDGVKYYS